MSGRRLRIIKALASSGFDGESVRCARVTGAHPVRMNGPHPVERKGGCMTRRRSVAVWTLIVLASLLALVSSLTVWSRQQLLDTDKFTSSSAKLLANPEIRATLSNRLVDLLNQRVDVQSQLEEKLPPRAKAAAPAIAAAIQNSTGQVITAFLGTAQAQAIWERLNRRAHTALVKVLEGKDAGALSTANGDV